jgi:hypothetical protein
MPAPITRTAFGLSERDRAADQVGRILKALLAGLPAAADLGYLGVEGIAIVPYRTPPGGHLHPDQADFNNQLSGIRAAAERAVASVKT